MLQILKNKILYPYSEMSNQTIEINDDFLEIINQKLLGNYIHRPSHYPISKPERQFQLFCENNHIKTIISLLQNIFNFINVNYKVNEKGKYSSIEYFWETKDYISLLESHERDFIKRFRDKNFICLLYMKKILHNYDWNIELNNFEEEVTSYLYDNDDFSKGYITKEAIGKFGFEVRHKIEIVIY